MSEFISVLFCFSGQGTDGAAGLIIYHIINPASFALQTQAAPITRKFLGVQGDFFKNPPALLTLSLRQTQFIN